MAKSSQILLGIFIVIIILSIVGILTVYFIYSIKLKESSSGKSNPDIKPNPEPTPTPPMPNVDTYIFFGEKLSNLTYDVNGKIDILADKTERPRVGVLARQALVHRKMLPVFARIHVRDIDQRSADTRPGIPVVQFVRL